MTANKIKTYDTAAFKEKYINEDQRLNDMLKTDFGKFFIVKVEDMIRLMKLPVPPTRATTHTIIYLTEGEAVMTIGSETYKIYKDECLVVPAGQVFSFDKIDINKGFLCNFHNDSIIGKFAKNDLLNDFEFLHVWGNPMIKLDPRTSGFVCHLFKRILLEYSHHGVSNAAILQPYFIALLCEINNVYKPGVISDNNTLVANRFKESIFRNIKTIQLVKDYASLLNITPNHLNKVVKKVTGKSPTQWIDEAIILEALVLLGQSDLSVNEIAYEIGLSDPSYFSRLFKKYKGISPLNFRKRLKSPDI